MGKEKEARDILSTLEAVSRERYVPAHAAALVHAGLGDKGQALDTLESACKARDVHLLVVKVDPKWDSFRADPRFQGVLRRCEFRTAARERISHEL